MAWLPLASTQESQSRHPQSARRILLAWLAKLNTGALGMTGRDARGHRGAGLKTAATSAKRRGRSCCEGNFAACSEAGDESAANHSSEPYHQPPIVQNRL